MSIERAIYASLPIGIENSVNGFQFFSYTWDFIKLLERSSARFRSSSESQTVIL